MSNSNNSNQPLKKTLIIIIIFILFIVVFKVMNSFKTYEEITFPNAIEKIKQRSKSINTELIELSSINYQIYNTNNRLKNLAKIKKFKVNKTELKKIAEIETELKNTVEELQKTENKLISELKKLESIYNIQEKKLR